MDEAIKSQLGSKYPSEITELALDNVKATSISGLNGEDFPNLTTLSFVNVGLTSLDGLAQLPQLISIDLSENKLTGEGGSFDVLAKNCALLCRINLCSNDIKSVDVLAPLAKLQELEYLDIFECPISDTDADYRSKVFALIPQLKYLDNFDNENVEADDNSSIDDEEQLDDEDDDDEVLSSDDEEDEEEEEEETDVHGLAYLDSSKALQDEDESEDFKDENGAGVDASTTSAGAERASKRKHANGAGADSVQAKKVANENGAE